MQKDSVPNMTASSGSSKICFDRKIIRKGIIPLSFKEARRVRGPIYEVLIQELYEAGCTETAQNLFCLVEKERGHIEQETISDKMSDNKPLMFALFDNFKNAEKLKKRKVCGGLAEGFRLVHQNLELLEPYSLKYEWLLKDLFDIVTYYCECERQNPEAGEMIARIYFKYATFLHGRREEPHKAIDLLEKARGLVRGEHWESHVAESDEGKVEFLHAGVSKLLSNVLLNLGKEWALIKPEMSVQLADRALLAVAEVGAKENQLHYWRALIKKAEFLIECPKYKEALQILDKFKDALELEASKPYQQLNVELLLVEGICYTNLGDMVKAEQILQKTLQLCQNIGLKSLEARTFISLGKMWAQDQINHDRARDAFARAKQLMFELKDGKGQKQISYLMAKLSFSGIEPQLRDLIKNSSEMYKLRRWINRCKPFWTPHMEEEKMPLPYYKVKSNI